MASGGAPSPSNGLASAAKQMICCSGRGKSEDGDGLLLAAFEAALKSYDFLGTATKYVEDNRSHVKKCLDLFTLDGKLKGSPFPASCFNDLYKWTMFPVVTTVEKALDGVRCTFSVNIRDAGYRKALLDSATHRTTSTLYNDVKEALKDLQSRPFDRSTFERVAADYNLPGWGPDALDAVCGKANEPRMLIQEFKADSPNAPSEPSNPNDVLVEVFVAHDEKLKEKRVYIEATGPWHRVTWLETSMMQCVYDVLLRDRKRQQFNEADESWYPKWLAEVFCRCVRSVDAANKSGLSGALFTGRRTGGLSLMMLQGLYTQSAFTKMLGTSSVTSSYLCEDVGIPKELIPRCAGTHAHELSMVIGASIGEVDDKAGMPLSQIVGHMVYFYRSRPQGDVRDPARKPLMPMLPDTLGSRAFMKTASKLTVPTGPHKGEGILSVIAAARQDSGGLDSFKSLMDEFKYTGDLMASEIETADDLYTARDNGYSLFGAGGFMGDSEKAWDVSKTNISMACKVLRVYTGKERKMVPFEHLPVKTGETSDEGKIKEGKFEADGTLSPEQIAAIRARAQVLANAESKISDEELQALFEETLSRIIKDQSDDEKSQCSLS